MHDIQPYLETLAALALPEGGWGYSEGQPIHLEPTCLGILALSLDREKYGATIDKALNALRQSIGPDGALRLARGREEAVWATALGLYVLGSVGAPEDELKKLAARILAYRGVDAHNTTKLDVHDIDLKLIGWPWAEGNFSWTEPTAWACLALRRTGYGKHPRVEEGLRLLIDRTFDGGGINYGNRFILGKCTEPIPGPTALMLIALQGQEGGERLAASVKYLQQLDLPGDDLDHLCWSRLALSLHPQFPGIPEMLADLDRRIVAAYEERKHVPWVKSAPVRIALTAMALGSAQRNAFQLPAGMNGELPTTIPIGKLTKKASLGERFRSVIQGLAVEAIGRLRPLPPQTQVHIARAKDYDDDLAGVLSRQYESFRTAVPLKGKRVVLKPNMVEYHRDKVINTNPKVVAAAIELCRREGAAEIIVAEGPGHWRNVEYLVNASGLGDVLRHYNVPFVDLNHDEPVKTPNLGRLTGLSHLYLARTVMQAEVLISMPKLKTHHWAGATLSMKNLFGTLPGICYGWPKNELHWRGIENSIVDIALTRTPELAIVDGIVGMEGDGPLNGTPKQFGALIMGTDVMAVDATCCRLMQLDPTKIGFLVLGTIKKLGLVDAKQIQQVGESIESMAQRFETVPHFKELSLTSA